MKGYLDDNWRGEPTDAKPAGIFLQYKGTDICLDFHCPCNDSGEPLHFDGYFAYTIQCPPCGTIYEMPPLLEARVISANDHAEPVIPS